MPKKSLFPTPPTQALFLASNQLNDVARKMAVDSADDHHACLVAILFSAAWFEASINEAIDDLFKGSIRDNTNHIRVVRLAAQAAGLDERFASLDRKLRVLCAAATNKPLIESDEPWPSVSLLVQLRNWMMHLRPELLSVREGEDHDRSSLVSTRVHPLVTELVRVGAIKQVPQGIMVPVSHAAQMPGVGAWAYRAAYQGLRVVDTWFPERYRSLVEASQAPPPVPV